MLRAAGNWRAVPWQAWAAILYMGVFGSAVAYVVVLLAAAVFGGFAVERVYVLAAGAGDDSGDFDLGEKGSWMQVLGGALALGGVYWTESGRASN